MPVALIHEARGNADRTLDDLDRAIELTPQIASASLQRGRLRVDRGDLDGALTDFETRPVPPPQRPGDAPPSRDLPRPKGARGPGRRGLRARPDTDQSARPGRGRPPPSPPPPGRGAPRRRDPRLTVRGAGRVRRDGRGRLTPFQPFPATRRELWGRVQEANPNGRSRVPSLRRRGHHPFSSTRVGMDAEPTRCFLAPGSVTARRRAVRSRLHHSALGLPDRLYAGTGRPGPRVSKA